MSEIVAPDGKGPVVEPEEPTIDGATQADLMLAIRAIGSKSRYGGLLICALAGIYAERARAAEEGK